MASESVSAEDIRAMLRITCADAGPLLSDYYDDVLQSDDRDRVAAHVGGCVACGVILDQVSTVVQALRATGAVRPHPTEEAVYQIMVQSGWPRG